MKKQGRWCAIVLALFIGLTQVAFPATTNNTSTPPVVQGPTTSDITIPSEIGYILETHPQDHAPLIIQIQEAHTNLEGQQHLAAILEHLVKQYGLKLILVEGGQGDASLAKLRHFGSIATRKEVGEQYLRLGLLSGEEYLDFVSNYPLTLWGVDQQELHQQNVDAFVDAEPLQHVFEPLMTALQGAVQALTSRWPDPALDELTAKIEAYAGERLPLGEYAAYLLGLAARQGIAEADYPALAQFHATRQLEQSLDLAKVQEEQTALMAELRRRAAPASLERLHAQVTQLKAGAITREVFYAALQGHATAAGISLEPSYPQLERYLRLLRASARLQPTAMSGELEALADRLRQVVPTHPQRRHLQRITDQLQLLQRLLALKLSPSEYAKLQSLQVADALPAAADFLEAQLAQEGLPGRPVAADAQRLVAALPRLLRFYEVAQQRDAAMVAHTLAKVRDTGEPLAVLITGGFHASDVTAQLTQAGVGVIVVAPKTVQATDEALYHAVLKYKNGQGTLGAVEMAAQRSAAAH